MVDMGTMPALPEGVKHWPGYLTPAAQNALLDEIRQRVKAAPLYTPKMPRTGKEMSVRMTNFGELGWVTDKERGYRYQNHHPVTGKPWPKIPRSLLGIWRELADYPHPPQACLLNFYDDSAKMGMHQDRDEKDFDAPVLSLSLGSECLFRVGSTQRGGKTVSFRLASGDAMMLSGASRLAFHGVDRIYPGTSDLLSKGGRLNITMRRVSAPSV